MIFICHAAQTRTNARKAKLLADNKSVNNDTMSVKSNESKFITDYKSQTTRWTTNTATTRFFPPKRDDNNANSNANNDNINTNTSSIDSRLFTDSFLQTNNNDNNDHINNNRNTANRNQNYQQFQSIQHQSNHPIPQLPLPYQQQLQASNTPLLTQSHANNPQPQRSKVNVTQNPSINIQNPMLSINTNNTDQLAQQRHANRIFHAADSTHGKYQSQAQRLPPESSFGIQAPFLSSLHTLQHNHNEIFLPNIQTLKGLLHDQVIIIKIIIYSHHQMLMQTFQTK